MYYNTQVRAKRDTRRVISERSGACGTSTEQYGMISVVVYKTYTAIYVNTTICKPLSV